MPGLSSDARQDLSSGALMKLCASGLSPGLCPFVPAAEVAKNDHQLAGTDHNNEHNMREVCSIRLWDRRKIRWHFWPVTLIGG